MTITLTVCYLGREREIELKYGATYEVQPMKLSIAKFEDVGRRCVLLELDNEFIPSAARVEWLDTGKQAVLLDLSDLVLVDF